MQVRNESDWQAFVKELRCDEEGEAFHDFVVAWAEQAEQVMGQDGEGANPAEALRITLSHIENFYERKTIWILGQCLVVFCMHWKHGEKLSELFTEFELRLVEDITLMKVAQLQAQADEALAGAE